MSVHEVTTLLQNFNWHTPSWDLFILGFWALGSILYAFTAGRGRVINILLSIYIAKLMVYEAPFLTHVVSGKLPTTMVSLQQLATFVLVFLVLFLFLGRYAFRTSADGRQAGAILFGVVFSFLQIGLLISIILHYLPAGAQSAFGPLIQLVFLSSMAGFVWLAAPLAFLIFLGKFIADPNEL